MNPVDLKRLPPKRRKQVIRARQEHYSDGIDWPEDGAKFVPKRLRRYYELGGDHRWYRRFNGGAPQPAARPRKVSPKTDMVFEAGNVPL